MKIKQGFMLREVAGNYVVVAVGEASKKFNGVINLNESGAFIWKKSQSIVQYLLYIIKNNIYEGRQWD